MKRIVVMCLVCAIYGTGAWSTHAAPHDTASETEARSIPTTSNPVGNGSTGSRVLLNPSFEQTDFTQAWSTFARIAEDKMHGWKTTHPFGSENYDGYNLPGGPYRLIEL